MADNSSDVSPAQAVAIAIEQSDATAPGSRIAESLYRLMPTAAFWVEAAAELHRRNRHMDALDCWKAALEEDAEAVDRSDMARTLLAVSNGDDLLCNEALSQYEQVGNWQDVASLRHRLNHGDASVLAAVEAALEKKPDLDWDEFYEFPYADITSWYELGLFYLQKGDKPKALGSFGRALCVAPDDLATATYIAKAISENIQVDFDGREISSTPPA